MTERDDAYPSPPFTMLVQCVTNRTDGYEWHGPWFPVKIARADGRRPRPVGPDRRPRPRPPEVDR